MNDRAKNSLLNIFFIVLINLLPVYFVLMRQADVFVIVIIFWLESCVIGFFNVLKMAYAKGEGSALTNKMSVIPFFILHYYVFMLAQLIFIIAYMAQFSKASALGGMNLKMMFLALTAGHAISFASDYIGSGRYEKTSPSVQMFMPYGRVFVQQFVVVLGGFLLVRYNLEASVAFLMILVVTKTIADIIGYAIDKGLSSGALKVKVS